MTAPQNLPQIDHWVDEAIDATPVYDIHTHLYPASFGRLMLWGIDELVTYHYLIAEVMRVSDVPYEQFWALSQAQQADLIWQKLFVENPPISEACRGVLTVLSRLGLDPNAKDLKQHRDFFRSQDPEKYVDKVFELANARTVVMTNDVFDTTEREIWLADPQRDPRFKGVLRIDPLLQGWPDVAAKLGGMGYEVSREINASDLKEIRRFLTDWIDRLEALYVAVSLTPDWRYPDESSATKVIQQAILPVCRETNIPFALMIGVSRQANPQLRLAGDSVGKADIRSLERLLAENPANKFLCTMLSRENQHELAVTTRKFRNLMLFGCWWFLNNPMLIEEITRMRMELLGTTFIPQHSDCRILDQLIYKWDHSRAIIAKVMKDKFRETAAAGWNLTQKQVQRTAGQYLGENFERFLADED